MAVAFIAILALFLGANFYVFYRLWHLVPDGAVAARWAVAAVGIVVLVCLIAYFLLTMVNPPGWLMTGIYSIGTSWIFFLLYFLIAFLIMDLVRITGLAPMEWMKTGSWAAFGAVVLSVTAIMVVGNIVYHNKKRVELNIALDKPLDSPLKIVAMSDVHLGYGIGRRELSRWVEMINREKPDLVLIAGDIVDSSIEPLLEQDMAAVFRSIESRYGIYAILGNHEYISGIDKSLAFYRDAGITLLRDSVATVGGMVSIAGRDDMTNSGRKPVAELLTEAATGKPVILLDHQPYHLEEATAAGVDVQFSGHTHRGQVWPISWITDALFEKSRGYLYKIKGESEESLSSKESGDGVKSERIAGDHEGTHFYISTGIGIWGGKFRIGTRSEYVVINLTGMTKR